MWGEEISVHDFKWRRHHFTPHGVFHFSLNNSQNTDLLGLVNKMLTCWPSSQPPLHPTEKQSPFETHVGLLYLPSPCTHNFTWFRTPSLSILKWSGKARFHKNCKQGRTECTGNLLRKSCLGRVMFHNSNERGLETNSSAYLDVICLPKMIVQFLRSITIKQNLTMQNVRSAASATLAIRTLLFPFPNGQGYTHKNMLKTVNTWNPWSLHTKGEDYFSYTVLIYLGLRSGWGLPELGGRLGLLLLQFLVIPREFEGKNPRLHLLSQFSHWLWGKGPHIFLLFYLYYLEKGLVLSKYPVSICGTKDKNKGFEIFGVQLPSIAKAKINQEIIRMVTWMTQKGDEKKRGFDFWIWGTKCFPALPFY